MSLPIVHMSLVSKSFDGRPVLSGLDWQIERGQIVGLLGRNGAGKSTLLESMLGLHDLDFGSATLYGQPAGDLSDDVRARIGYVPQQPSLFEWLTPAQMLAYFKALYPRWNQAKVDGLLGRWGFDALAMNKQIGKFSGGEKQRLSIIRALAHDPDLLILDEPVSSLDPAGRREFLHELIDDVIERDTTVIFSTHILSDIERVAMDVAFLKNGKISLQGRLDELTEGAYRISGPAPEFSGARLDGEIQRSADAHGTVTVVVRMAPRQIDALRNNVPHWQITALALEELFLAVTL